MRTFRLALAQMNPTVGDLEGNARKIIELTEQARAVGAHLVAFPEMAIPGYPAEDLVFKPSFLRDNVEAMRRVVAASRGIAVAVGFVDSGPDVYNACAVAYDGRLAGTYRKIHLPTYGVFDEDRYFRRGCVCPVFVINGVRVGVTICEDLWWPVGPVDVLREAGVEVVVNVNASPFHVGKGAERQAVVSARASDNGVWLAYVNMVGGQDELVFDGGSFVADPAGEVAARSASFVEDLMVLDLDADRVSEHRLQAPARPQGDPEALGKIGRAQVVEVSPYSGAPGHPLPPVRRVEPLGPCEEVYRALVLGVRDYVVKSGFSHVLIGMSGGIDSALTAVIAVDALGSENVTGVSMPSRYSSEGSVADSKALAQRLGMELRVAPIEPAHAAFLDMLEPHFRGTEPNLAEENVQARIRGNVLMTLANKFGWLVLTTGNKSETAMGYATLYGDMAGGFAVIKDVPKTLVYRLARWRNEHGAPRDAIPESVLRKPPSAELKPGQRDQDTLPPYELLDPIVKAYAEDDRGLQDIVDMGFDREMVRGVIAAIDRNEYKRRQAPPGIKITPKAFGKDRRLPIVNHYRQV